MTRLKYAGIETDITKSTNTWKMTDLKMADRSAIIDLILIGEIAAVNEVMFSLCLFVCLFVC